MGAIKQPGPPKAGQKTYQVWHANDPGASHFPEDYTRFADVRANSLREAAGKTAGLPEPGGGYPSYSENEGVRKSLDAPYRGTGPGDVIVDPCGTPYRYEGSRFAEIGAPGLDPELETALGEIEASWPRARPAPGMASPDSPPDDERQLTPGEEKALFAEWRQDYAAARERDIGALERSRSWGATGTDPLHAAMEAAANHAPEPGREIEP
ncbi:hypothetical protein [Tautonia rosea]|uniref:hypothetical protein n=1 Tax=Tautonia rosea TaxID=2728037 RepID=UPI001472E82A|nr:hypothetical protein [Tautonia rosea]